MPVARSSSYLIVEGDGDVAFFKHALSHVGKADVAVERTLGTSGLQSVLAAVAVALQPSNDRHGPSKVAVIFDADKQHAAHWDEYVGHFASAGLPRPVKPGQWVNGKKDDRAVQTMLYLLPGPNRTGAIETLLLKTLAGSTGYTCVDDLVKCWTDAGIVGAEIADKVRMQAWLSQYADKKYIHLKSAHDEGRQPWNLDHPELSPLLDLLRQL